MRISKLPEQRRAELVAAARRLFDERGVLATRVSDIVGSVGVAQGVFYYYFSSKKEIVEAVVGQVMQELESRLKAILSSQESFCLRLAMYIEVYIDVIDQFLADDDTSLSALAGSGGDPLAGQAQEFLEQQLYALVQQGVQSGEVGVQYPRECAETALLGLRALAARRLPARSVVYAVVGQCMGLPQGQLAECAKKFAGKQTKSSVQTPQGGI